MPRHYMHIFIITNKNSIVTYIEDYISGQIFGNGCGIHDILIPNNVQPVIITGRELTIVLNRYKEFGITKTYQRSRGLTTMNAVDFMQSDGKLGFIGVYGNRIANMIVTPVQSDYQYRSKIGSKTDRK